MLKVYMLEAAVSVQLPMLDGALEIEGHMMAVNDGVVRRDSLQRQQQRAKPGLSRRAAGNRSPPRMEPALTMGQDVSLSFKWILIVRAN